jgi:hypothetical protein
VIIRTPNRERFVVIDKSSVEDDRLSWKARGLLAYLLSKPDGWHVYTSQLAKASPDGRASVLSGLRELENSGYIVRSRGRKEDGTWDSTDIQVFETPQAENRTTDTKPQVDTAVRLSAGGLTAGGKSTTSKEGLVVKTEKSEEPPSLAPAKADAEERVALRAAVIEACQLDPERITSSAEGALSKATKDISEVGATPEEVVEAANAYRTRFPQASVTPLALAKHWPTLSGSPSQEQPRRSIPWYERIAIVTARSISDPVEARAQIVDELGSEADFVELSMMAWERTRNDVGAAHCGAF